jgi:uncharacterized protein YutE (UPF0331/DUF86 family)
VTDRDLLEKRLALIVTSLQELRTLARPCELERDVRERRFVEHTLQIAIQAALDVAAHIVADRRLPEPATYRDLFDRIAADGWIDQELTARLRRMAGFRNVLVHGYADVDLRVVREILDRHLPDLEAFVYAVRARLDEP